MATATPIELDLHWRMTMWYFAWILGLPLAATFAVLNAMWYELMDDRASALQAHTSTGMVGRQGKAGA
jgi:cyd operon protein YbgT